MLCLLWAEQSQFEVELSTYIFKHFSFNLHINIKDKKLLLISS